MAQFQFPKLMKLTNQQRILVLEWAATGFDEKKRLIVMRRAGYSWPEKNASKVFGNAKVKEAIDEQRNVAAAKLEDEFGDLRDRVIREAALLAFHTIGDVVTFTKKDVYLKPSSELKAETIAAIQKVKNGAYGTEIAMYDKGVNIERLARMLGMMQPDQPPPGGVTLIIGDPGKVA